MYNKILSLLLIIIFINNNAFSQSSSIIGQNEEYNVITTAVPFLSISSDSRSGAMGDAGVATTPDINSIQYNAAKYAFIENEFGVSISYVPWLRNLVNDINLLHVGGFKKLGEQQTISASLLYFSLGSITFTDNFGSEIMNYTPNEFQLKAAYSRLLTNDLSLSVSLGYVYSNLSGSIGNEYTTYGNAATADIGFFYKKPLEVSGKNTTINLGLSILNIGNKISYSKNNNVRSFLPTTFKLGSSWAINLDDYNTFMFTGEISKLLVPTPPIYYETDAVTPTGDTIFAGEKVIKYGKNSDETSVGSAILTSWYDAPGTLQEDGTRSVLKEEIKEFTWSIGGEYWYSKQFALRAGYFHESMMKGNRQFYTIGLGLKLNTFGIDFSYLIAKKNNPLENTLRFSLLFDFSSKKPVKTN
jgi:hypothetical protein